MKDDGAETASLVVKMDELLKANKSAGLKGFIVFTAGPERKDALEQMAATHGTTVPLTFPQAGTLGDALAKYKINPQAENTFMVTKSKKVRFNMVNVTTETFDEVASAAKEVVGE